MVSIVKRSQLIVLTCLLLYVTSSIEVEGQPYIRVGAFNIQVFGIKKSKNTYVMDALAKIIPRYDLLLIQEIRDKSQTAIVKLLNKINKDRPANDQYSMVVSGRLGRTASKEQYAYMYRPAAGLAITQQAEFDDGSETKIGNIWMDDFQREPFLVKVTSQNTVPKTFALIGIHVDPGEAVQEIRDLEKVFEFVKTSWGVQDVIAMGDLNADCSYVRKSKWKNIPIRNNSAYTWYIGDGIDTTVKTTHCAYDRFIFTGGSWDYTYISESAVVYRFDEKMPGMNNDQAKHVSDHYPIEFKLKIRESSTVSILNVYITLSDPSRSLEKSVVYYLSKSVNSAYIPYLSVIDDSNYEMGTLWDDGSLKSTLLSVEALTTRPIEVMRISRKYLLRQRVKITIHVGNSEKEAYVKDELANICMSYECKM